MKLRQSEFTAYAHCRRRHHFRYTLGLVPSYEEDDTREPGKGSRDAGTMMHTGISYLNEGTDLDDANDKMFKQALELSGQEELSDEWLKEFAVATAMLRHYNEWQEEGNDVGIDFLAVEESFEVPIPGTAHAVYGQIDAVIYDPLVGIKVRDYKSVQTLTQTPEDVDFQLRTYAWAWWKFSGQVPKRAEHLSIKRVLGTGRAKKPFVGEHQIPINKTILEAHEKHLTARANELAQAKLLHVTDAGLWPNPTRDCSWKCDYRDVCPMVDDGSDLEYILGDQFVQLEDVLYLEPQAVKA